MSNGGLISRRATRIKACELAAQCMQGQAAMDSIGARLMSLCVFFENYIDVGAAATDEDMRLLSRRRVKNLKVVSGGRL